MYKFHNFGAPINLRRIEGGDDGGAAPAGSDAQSDNNEPPAPPADSGKTFTQADLDKLVEQRLTRERKKYADYDAVKARAAKLDELEQASATDLEKAVKAAQDQTRAEVAREYGQRTVRGVMRAQLSQGMKPADVDALLDDLNLGKYVADDGTIDDDAVAKTVSRLAPRGPIDLGQGGRGDGPSIESRIADAQKAGDWKSVVALQNQKYLNPKG